MATLLARENLTPVDDPLHQLQMIAAEVIQLKNILGPKVEQLASWTYDDLTDHEDIKAVLHAYERALDRCTSILVGMARLDIDARMARISEAQAEKLRRVVEAVLDSPDLALDAAARTTGRKLLARHLQVVTGPTRRSGTLNSPVCP